MEYVLHVDGDSFFASCEMAWKPELKGKPVVVGEDRGIACAMSKEAKKLGITRGMPIFEIREKFPKVVVLTSHFELYEHYASKLCRIIEPKLSILERYSIDECFGLVRFPKDASNSFIIEWLKNLKDDVQKQTGLTYSFGLARTKVLAKVASKYRKPDGCTVLFPNMETEVLKQTPIESIWGIGWSLSRRFQALNIKTAYEFAIWSPERVENTFARPTKELWYELRGERMLGIGGDDTLPKSLQSTKSFTPFSTDLDFVTAELLKNLDIVFARMRGYGVVTKAISIFFKNKDRRYYTSGLESKFYTDNPLDVIEEIKKSARKIFREGVRYKSTGVSVLGLISKSKVPLDLFGSQQNILNRSKIMETIDSIRERFGNTSIDFLAIHSSTKDRGEKYTQRAKTDTYVSGLPLPYLGEVS